MKQRCLWIPPLLLTAWPCARAAQRHEPFDQDPGWEWHHNRSGKPETIRQDFGWAAGTTHAGGAAGEIGGWITPAAEPAYYAKRLPARTLSDGFTASGALFVEKGAGHTLIGFFDAGTLNEWRTPKSIVLREALRHARMQWPGRCWWRNWSVPAGSRWTQHSCRSPGNHSEPT